MNARSHAVRRQSARRGDLVVAEAGDLAHQEHVAIDVGQRREGFVDLRAGVLGRRPGRIGQRLGRRSPLAAAVMIRARFLAI